MEQIRLFAAALFLQRNIALLEHLLTNTLHFITQGAIVLSVIVTFLLQGLWLYLLCLCVCVWLHVINSDLAAVTRPRLLTPPAAGV